MTRADVLRRELGLAPGQSPCSVAGCDPLVEVELSASQARENAARCHSEPECWLAAVITQYGEERFAALLDEAEAEAADA